MSREFDRALEDCLQRIESGEPVEQLLADYPGQANSLREHLQFAAALRRPIDVSGEARGRQAMLAALASSVSQGGISPMSNAASTALKLAGGLAIAAVAIIAISYLSGNLHVQVGNDAAASDPQGCLNEVFGNLADPPDGVFTVDDLLAAKDAFQNQNTDPRYDRDGDSDVDIDDLMLYIQDLRTCFEGSIPPIPAP
jgi:hypothetical protein